jgi:uncharacterized protein
MGRPVVHWELWSEDPAQAAKFYQAVFDWQVQHIPGLNYHAVKTGGSGGIDGGIMKPQRGPWPGKLAFYIDVDDLDAYARKIREAGGKIVVDKVEVPESGGCRSSKIRTGACSGCGRSGLRTRAVAEYGLLRRAQK